VGFGGSEIRPEATGFGVVLFAECALEDAGDKFEGKRCIVSGSGWVGARGAAGAAGLGVAEAVGWCDHPHLRAPPGIAACRRGCCCRCFQLATAQLPPLPLLTCVSVSVGLCAGMLPPTAP
jgi:hypothetical protein